MFVLYGLGLNSQSLVQWDKTIGGSGDEEFHTILQTTDGGYVLGGHSESNISGDKNQNKKGLFDYWILKTNNLGAIQWQQTIGGNSEDYLNSMQQTADGGYILGGFSNSTISGDKSENPIGMGYHDYWIVKTNSVGVVQWENTIGGSNEEILSVAIQTNDNGYIIGGYSDSNASGDKTQNCKGFVDYWIVKLDNSGNISWQRTYGGSGQELLRDIKQTSDGGYIVAGHSNSNISGDKTQNSQGLHDFWILKLDNSGTIQWQKTYGGSADDAAFSIAQAADGGYIVGGWSQSSVSGDKTQNCQGLDDYWILKLNSSGNLQWQKTIGGSDEDFLNSIIQTTDGGYLCGGSSSSNISGDKNQNGNGWNDYWIVKIDNSGNIQGQATIGGSDKDGLSSVIQAVDGNYILGGSSQSNISGDKTQNCKGLDDYWIVKISSAVGISELEIKNEGLIISPNPSGGTFDLEVLNKEFVIENAEIRISNIIGQCLKTEKLFSKKQYFDFSDLRSGIYFLQISSNKSQAVSKRLVIEP